MTLPKDEKATVLLFQPVLLMQLSLPARGNVTIELSMIDTNNNHRRFFISTAIREIKVTALHASMPCPSLVSHGWVNLALDLADLVLDTHQMTTNFKGITFYALSGITVSGTFRLRKVMTLKHLPFENNGDGILTSVFRNDRIPSNLDFPLGVSHCTQIINMTSITNKAHTPQKVEEPFSARFASSIRLHTPPRRKATPKVVEPKASIESNMKKTIKSSQKLNEPREETPEANPLTILYAPRVDPQTRSRSVSSHGTKDDCRHGNSCTATNLSDGPVGSQGRLSSVHSRTVSSHTGSVGPSDNNDMIATHMEASAILDRMKESLVLESQGDMVELPQHQEEPTRTDNVASKEQSPEIGLPNNDPPANSLISSTRCSPITQLENEYQEFLKRSQQNDLERKEWSPLCPTKDAIEEIQEQIECVEETEMLDTNQVKFLRFVSTGENESLKHMESVEQKFISSDTGLRMEQKLKMGVSKKRLAPAAELEYLKTDSTLEPWNDSEVSSPMVRYVSETERESIEVPLESDEEDKQGSEEHFFIYDELGSKKEYQINS
jgi:hypothetical protein